MPQGVQITDNFARLPVLPPLELSALVADTLGKVPVQWGRPHTGLFPAERLIVQFANGSRAFVKAAVDAQIIRP